MAIRSVSHVVIHTAAARRVTPTGWKPVDQSAETIRAYHLSKGWSDIGYHWVVRMDGTVEEGRHERYAGAHREGFNISSIGVCFTGHGDIADFTEAQKEAGAKLVAEILVRHKIDDEFLQNMNRVLGHRESNVIVKPEYKTTKTCPGVKVDMREFRLRVRKALEERE